ncbi:MAG: adenine deaminase [Caldilineaceae bacterium]|nr:adenine deaminase [Caldilineaceae bacterium]
MDKRKLLAVARGDEKADLLLRNARLVNVFSGEIEETDIAVAGDRIAGIGPGYVAHHEVDLAGAYVAPGFIDAHVHIESSLCTPPQFAAAVLPRGVTTVVTDPHEIANVAGVDGIRFIAESSRDLPLHVVVMAPSCVPATDMETSGAVLTAADLAPLLADGTVHGLAEMMNFPGAAAGAPDVLAKLDAFAGRPIDGHAPAMTGHALNAYAAAGVGSEHECTTVAEAAEKLARGFYVLIREATNAHNLHPLLPLITEQNSRRICFCTDDRVPGDLLDQGSVDYMVREAIAYGIDPITAIRMVTLNTAEWFGLHDRGAVAPGRVADFVVFDDLAAPLARLVYVGGRLIGEKGDLVEPLTSTASIPSAVRATLRVDWSRFDLRVPARGRRMRAIVSLPNQLVTQERVVEAPRQDGYIVADPTQDLLKMAVVDRHKASGSMGLGFIMGVGLHRGAMAGSVAHDHHNLVIIGADDLSMTTAARAVAEMGGGLAVADGDQILAALPLPVGGIMSDQPIAAVRAGYDAVLGAAAELGSPLHDPFMAMSFMALEVIPKLKLTDRGLVDVEKFSFVDLFVDEG